MRDIFRFKMYVIPVLILVGALMAGGCYYDSKEFLFPELASSCDTNNISYSGSVQPVLSQYCLSCHSNAAAQNFGANIRLEDYADVLTQAQNGRLVGAISHQSPYSPMPKGTAKLSDCIITSISLWVDSGALDN